MLSKLFILGACAVLAPVAVHAFYRSAVHRESQSIATLRERLDSVRTALPTASTAADSARLLQSISEREEAIGVWAYHLAHNQQIVNQYWEVPGLPTITVAAGLVCLIGGLSLRRSRSGERTSPEP